MARRQYQSIREERFLRGIDARSAESEIQAGYVRDSLNTDLVQGYASKRPGYMGYSGNIPVRVASVEWNSAEDELCFTLDTAATGSPIDLSNIRSSPLVVYGRLSSGSNGVLSAADAGKWYPGFYQKIRKTFQPGTNTLVIPGTEHGLGTTNMFLQVVHSDSQTNLSNSLVEYTSLVIDESSYDITIGYTNSTGAAFDVFVYYARKDAVAGSVYVGTPFSAPSGPTPTVHSIPAATHQLSNFQIIARLYADDGSTRQLIVPQALTLDQTTGEVLISILNTSGSTQTIVPILSTAPAVNFTNGSLSGGTYTATILAPETPFLFPGVYVQDSPTVLSQVIPDEVVYDSATNSVDITFQNPGSDAFTIYWETGEIRSTQICVTDTDITGLDSDTRPQLTLWGLDHSEIYGSEPREGDGWANHIDSYRIPGENRVICGLGGNLFSSRSREESAAAYQIPSAYPSLFARTQSSVILGPALSNDAGRTRGRIGGTGIDDNWATITSVEYDSGNQWTRCNMTIPGLTVVGTLSDIIATTPGSEDTFSVSDMPYSRHNGEFLVRQVQVSGTVLSVWVDNPRVSTSDWDDTGCAGFGGIFSDRIPLQSDSPFIPGDTISSSAIPGSLLLTVSGTSSTATSSVTVTGIVENLTLQGGVLLSGSRTSHVIPVRDVSDSAVVSGFVRGDMVQLSGFNRQFRVLGINSDVSRAITVTGDGDIATVVLGAGDTSGLAIGMRVLLLRCGVYTGVQEISAIVDGSSFQFLSEETASESGTLLGRTLHIGEEIDWRDTVDDSVSLSVPRRWIPIEAPDDNDDLTPSTYVRHLTANSPTSQPPLRSVMVQDNMYLSNGDDPVQRFDGVNIARAGIPDWQPGLFSVVDTGAAAEIVIPQDLSATPSALIGSRFTVPIGTEQQFPVGSTIRYTDTVITAGVDFTVTQSYSNAANGFIHVTRTPDLPTSLGTTPLLRRLSVYQYYFRLNAVDINGNVTASAVAQSSDYTFVLAQNAAIKHKLVGLPVFDNYDYDSLYLQVYRTKGDTPAPYYLVYQTRLEYDGPDGYVEFVDSLSDIALTDLDPVNSSLRGAELGIGWQAPLRSKYVTTAANSLVTANFSDYPVMDIRFLGDSSLSTTAPAGTLLTFRRDSASSGAVTNMSQVARYEFRNVSAGVNTSSPSSSSTTFTFTCTPGGTAPAVGNWVYLYYSTVAVSGRDTDCMGWWQISAVSGAGPAYTLTARRFGTADVTNFPDKALFATDKRDIPVAIGTDGNYGSFSGNSSQSLFQLGRRLSLAINASMRMVDKQIPAYAGFTPWLAARGGNDTAVAGRVVITAPVSEATTPELELTTLTAVRAFVNDVEFSAGTSVPADIRLFPSRILVSYENFPEIFDSPSSVLDSESDSAIDINPSDGQEITGVVPFFGDSAFGAAQKSGVVVAFKQNSIYLVDINEKRAGRPAVQRLETEGIGCTAPGSISVTSQGIMFANESGIYALRRDLTVEFVGEYMDRNWVGRVNRSRLDLVVGHHYTIGRRYKISVPLVGSSRNSDVYVYDHTNEKELGRGSWSRYDNHPATGWCNLLQDAYFASSTGRVFVVRRAWDRSDYQDDNQAINMVLETRPNSFGVTNTRKVLDGFVIGYRASVPSENTAVGTAVDTEQQYTATTSIRVLATPIAGTGTGDVGGKDVVSIYHTTSRRRGIYFSIRVANSEYCEAVQVASIEYSIGGLASGRGVLGASQTPGKSGR